jgi:hypothetical protein
MAYQVMAFCWGCDFLQAHPLDIAVFVNNLSIPVSLRGFKFHWFIADGAVWQSQVTNKSQKRWHWATSPDTLDGHIADWGGPGHRSDLNLCVCSDV